VPRLLLAGPGVGRYKEGIMALRSKSGIKKTKTSRKRQARNLEAKAVVKKAFKAAEKAIASKSSNIQEAIKKAVSAMDKAVERGIIHRNKAARKKSRLILRYNKAE
jgi:small subunit ribosomal protein S20